MTLHKNALEPRLLSRFPTFLFALAVVLFYGTLGVGQVLAQTPPSITGLSPASGLVGTPVTITGTNFGASQGTSTIMFGATPGTPTSWNDTQIVVSVPNVSNGLLSVSVVVGGLQNNQPQPFTVTTAFSLTASMQTARGGNTMTVLDGGTVLVAGGYDGSANTLVSAELYNPATATFTPTGNMNTPRSVFTAALLNNGTVLVAGGLDSSGNPLNSAELYDPVAKAFTPTGSMSTARSLHTETLLSDGTVLIAGGMDAGGNALGSAELYNPAAGTFSPAASLNIARYDFTATLLNNGLVLLAGGGDTNGDVLGSAELYDPVAGTFAMTGSMNTPRAIHAATPLNSGLVLVAGGIDPTLNSSVTVELYDPTAGTFAPTGSMNTARAYFTSTLLNNGTVLVVGGADSAFNILTSAELYDPASATFALTSGLNVARYAHDATLLGDGRALLVGGNDVNFNVLASAELYQPATLIPAGLVSIAVSPLTPSVAPGAVQPFIATGTFSDNSTRPLVSVAWSSSDNTVATITNDPGDRGTAYAIAFGSATISACTGSLCGSTTMTVGPPTIASLSPNAGAIAYFVTITGTNFGATQGASTVTFNGTTATPITWSPTSILVRVPVGAATGDVVVTVSGVASNGSPFTIGTPPAITSSVSPSPNANGWNNSNVTVSFSCIPGSAPIVFCPAPQIVSTEGALQLITGTAMDANGLTADTRQFIGLDKTKPTLSVTSPADGSVLTSATVVVTGTVSDSLSGVYTVTCDGLVASLSGGNFSCNISLNPGVNLLVVRATDRAGNVSASISHVTLDVPLPAPVSLKITPGGATLLVGDTQQFTAVDENDHQRTDATWTVSDTTIATITTASSPVLTAVAIGQVTLTAHVGAVSAQVQINALSGSLLPAGTVRWVAPSTPGLAVDSVLQAEPVDGAPDLYSMEVNTGQYQVIIRALTADGQQLWVANVESGDGPPPPWTWEMMADGRGGVLAIKKQGGVIEPSHLGQVIDFDAQTGSILWEFAGSDYVSDPGFAVGPDGTIYFTQVREQDRLLAVYPESLMAMDPLTGGTADIYDAPYGTASSNCGDGQGNVPLLSKPAVDPDGNALVLQSTTDSTATYAACDGRQPDTVNFDRKLSLVRIAPNGGSASASVQESNSSTSPRIIPGLVIPDGQGGAYAAWSDDSGNHISHGASDLPVPFVPREMVLGDNGDGYALGTVGGNDTLVAFQGWSFSVQYPDALHLVGATGADPADATAHGGVIVNDLLQGFIPFDCGGNQGTPFGTPLFNTTTGFNPADVTPLPLGNWVGPLSGSLSMFTAPMAVHGFASSASPLGAGNPQGQHQAPRCQRLKCALAPVNDVIVGPVPAERTVRYGVYSLKDGTLVPLYQKGNSYRISLSETDDSGPARKCTKGCTNSEDDPQGFEQGFFDDDLSAQFGGASTATQTYFVDLGQVQVFWPTVTFTQDGFQTYVWSGAFSQKATVSPTDPRGAIFIQNGPDGQHPFACQPETSAGERGCDTTLPAPPLN